MRSNFTITRNRIAEKLGNKNFLKIHFHTYRHWKATTELHNYHDRERVQIILGHKSADSTETYVHIDKMLYLQTRTDQFIVKRHRTEEEEAALIISGFEFVRFDEKIKHLFIGSENKPCKNYAYIPKIQRIYLHVSNN